MYYIISLFFAPESPTWHVLKGRTDKASEILRKLRNDELVAKVEIRRIIDNLAEQKNLNVQCEHSSYYKEKLNMITKGSFVRPGIILILLFTVVWMWTGEALSFYTVGMVQQLNVPINAYWISAGIGCYQFFAAILGIFISAIVQRRKHYIGSGIFVIVGLFILGTLAHLQKYEYYIEFLEGAPGFKWLPVFAFTIYFGGYTAGYITVCYMLLGELLPSNGRSIGSCIVIQCTNVSFFLVIKFTPNCVNILGMDGLFWMFTTITLLSVIFTYFCVPETFGLNLEEIEQHYRMICYPYKFKNNVKEKINRS